MSVEWFQWWWKKKQQKTERDQVEESERKKNPLIHSPSVVLWAVHLNWCQNERIFVVFFHSVFVCVWVHALFPISYNAIWNVSLLHCIVVRSVMRGDHRVIEIHGRKKEKYLETSFRLLPVHCFFCTCVSVCAFYFVSYICNKIQMKLHISPDSQFYFRTFFYLLLVWFNNKISVSHIIFRFSAKPLSQVYNWYVRV